MKSYNNMPPEQRPAQRLVDRFNADEQLWQSLAWKRRLRRKLHPRMAAKQRELLDLLEFAKACPPQDCIGQPIR